MRDRQAGFTLIELALVLAIVGLIVGMGARFGAGYLDGKRHEATNVTLNAIEEALIRFVAATGRLPCPADAAGAGLEDRALGPPVTCGSANNVNQTRGIVPYRTLGLSESQVMDGWSRFITYRVAEELALDDALDFTDVTGCPGGNLAGCVSGLGLVVVDAADAVIMDPGNATLPTGAAFVLISHGRNGRWSYTPGGGYFADTTTTALDYRNRNNNALVTSGQAATLQYVDTTERPDYDDILRRPSVLAVADRARLTP